MSTETTLPQEPRSGDVTIAGVSWLARMTDKARLEAAGTIDALDLEFPCPMDQRCLKQIGLEARVFQQLAVANGSDEALIAALRGAGAKL